MSDSANKFLFRAMWPRVTADGKPHTFVERLSELKQGREDFLTEDEYQQIRSEILRELVIRARMPRVMILFLLLITLGLAGVTIWSFVTGGMTGIWVWLLPLILTLVIWYHQARDYAFKRRLSVPQRLSVLDELVLEGLLSQDEFANLRGQIERLSPSDAQ
ncbi:MAG: hypothetical protein U1F83_16770 [Verrucomicrobiota bacterium]